MLNRQLLFDTAVAALYKQGKTSMNDDDCAYRAEDGSKCALGHCMADNRYDPAIEGLTATNAKVQESIDSKFGVVDARPEMGDISFLTDMQQGLHDNIFDTDDPEDFRATLKERAVAFAARYNLKVDVNLFTTE